MIYKLRGEFGEPFFKGTDEEVDKVRDAMIAYGIADHKLHIVYPEMHEFTIPDELKDKMQQEVTTHLAEGRDYSSYNRDEAEYEAEAMHDYTLWCEYHDIYCDYETDDEDLPDVYNIVQDLENTFKLEQTLTEES